MSSHIGGARQHTRIVFVKNLNYNTTGADLYNVFGRYGAIRQIRIGDAPKTKGTAYVVYQEMADAKRALDNLNGFHLNDRYLVVLAHMPARLAAKADLERREAELAELKQLHNIQDT
ncbi:RNA-binding domain-containing protein [Moesziomyces antarcticus]|uniref:Related to RNA-binding protein (RRM superfamily) n=2 Tax=Pseudozyma antarctica TaxID=84753 RepID=A0A5C3FKX2_PSEA2|nr:RNA-binding domain-containing protein [Moesziomyces antarcticus]GAK64483.1 RNA-binding domain-containing protein [Moesziomyces antarcticus]SPO45008.1 related to RNA-binding protein (RRM superfamily) [Moesziomyces antarcticus]